MNGKPLDKLLVDNRSIINVIPLKTLLTLGKTKDDIISTDLIIIVITKETARMLRVIPFKTTVGRRTSVTTFFIFSTTTSYKLLLGKDWI